MSSPITPLDPQQTAEQQNEAAHESGIHKDLVAIDQAGNVIFLHGLPDETISAHASRAAAEGHLWGVKLSEFLDWFQKNHGPKAQAGDAERAAEVIKAEQGSGEIATPPTGE
jgi:hypothetical protein